MKNTKSRTFRSRPLYVSFFLSICLMIVATAVEAHEHWLDLSSFTPDPGAMVEVSVCSGHHFPKSVFALKDEITGTLMVHQPDGRVLRLDTAGAEKVRTASFTPVTEGIHILSIELKRPGMDRPAYEMRCLVVAGSESDDPSRYGLGKGLEIVPLDPVSSATRRGTISFRVTLEGEAVECELAVVPEEGRTAWYKTAPDMPAEARIDGPGKYLVTASLKGRGCSLVFEAEGDDRK